LSIFVVQQIQFYKQTIIRIKTEKLMQLRKINRVLMVLAFFLAACSEKPVPQSLFLDKTQITFDASPGEQMIQVTANCSWSVAITEGSDWLSVMPKQGQGNGTLTLSAQANTGPNRTASIKIYSAEREARIAVTQKEQEILYWNVSQVRALYKGTDVTITDKIVVRATVISNYMHTDNGGVEQLYFYESHCSE
jgi:hypothetical protein